jgi:hypothetical protein
LDRRISESGLADLACGEQTRERLLNVIKAAAVAFAAACLSACVPVATHTSKPKVTPAVDVSRINWSYQTYDASCGAIGSDAKAVHAKLDNEYVVVGRPPHDILVWIDRYTGYQTQPPLNAVRGDVTGDGVADEAVLLDCKRFRSNPAITTQDLQVFTAGAKLLAHIPLPTLPYQKWFSSRFSQLWVEQGHLVATAFLYKVGDTSCCPSVSMKFTYKWDGQRFSIAKSEETDDPYPGQPLGG